MSFIQETESSPHSCRQIYQLVADIASYPQFLPWCDQARILQGGSREIQEGGQQLAELGIHFKIFRGSYVSRVTFEPPAGENTPCRVIAQLERGPFKHLENIWTLTPTPQGGCLIQLQLDFHFHSTMLQKLLGTVFSMAFQQLAHAFRQRAETLYGTPNL